MAAVQVKCPACGAPVPWTESSRFRPFCCERCRIMDLGAWAAERHRIAGEPADGPPDAGAEPPPAATEDEA
ncbi:MAG TPA: DNA gyrase inhibitor YacG [Burkholderiaceae bacterium]|nr:DNA gyrase inhibitor YacG [Burkholderiaceae bacterium]